MFEGVQHFCFDKDGTLTDVHSYWAHTSCLRADSLCRRLGLPASRSEAVLDAMGVETKHGRLKPSGPTGYQPRAVVLQCTLTFLASIGVSTDLKELDAIFAEVDTYQQRTEDYRIQVLPGVEEALSHLKEDGRILSIYSSDRLENIQRILTLTGLSPFFDVLVGGGCVSRVKPDPEGFQMACLRTGVPIHASGYVGDTADDLLMGTQAGARVVVGIASGLDSLDHLQHHTTHTFADMGGLCRSVGA